jgi:hypothetical protein
MLQEELMKQEEVEVENFFILLEGFFKLPQK